MKDISVGTYFSPLRGLGNPTGVITHAIELQSGLMAADGIDSFLYCDGDGNPESAIPGVRVERYRLPDRMMRRLLLSGFPLALDQMSVAADWIYSPRLQPVKTKKAKLVVTVHDTLHFEDPDVVHHQSSTSATQRHSWLIGLAIKRATIIAVVSEHLRCRLLDLFPRMKEDRICVVGNGARSAFYESASDNDDDVLAGHCLGEMPYLVFVGQLLRQKGAKLVVELAKRFQRMDLGLEIAVVGGNGEMEINQQIAEIESANGRLPIKRLGYLPASHLAVIMRRALCLILPSRCESFGIPAVEAMAAGTPVLASNVYALPEVVGDAGVLLSVDSADEWLEAINSVKESTSLRMEMIQSGRKRAEQFRWSACADRLVARLKSSK